MNMQRVYVFVLLFVLGGFFTSCKSDGYVDVSDIDVNVEVKRFEQDLYALNADSIVVSYNGLRASYGGFVDIFAESIIGIGKVGTPEFCSLIGSFVSDSMIRALHQEVLTAFPDTRKLSTTFTDAFRRFVYYFPERKVPDVYTFISGFNLSVGIDTCSVFIGLDRYLGPDVRYYSMLGIPKYMQQKMTPEKVPSDAVRAWVLGEFPFNDSVENVMSHMIWEGELLYVTSKLLPNQDVEQLMGFTPDQMRFCRNNEKLMWTYLIEHKLLFSTNSFDITRFINDAPFTSGFPQESPGRAVVWLGYRIVGTFMRNNPSVSLSDLMRVHDYNQILNGAKYRP